MESDKIYRGSCLCGTIQYTVTSPAEPDYMFFCHCSRCRKESGSVYGANIFFNNATLEWTAGEDNYVFYRVPDSRHSRAFCQTCGSAVPQAPGRSTLVVVPAGSLDKSDDLKPTAHIRYKDRAQWEDLMADIPCFDEYAQ